MNYPKDLAVIRYKLTKEQEDDYLWVKRQKINTDDNTICYWTKRYSSKRIKEVVNFAYKRQREGQEIKNIGGWIQNFLKTDQIVVNDNSEINQEFCVSFVESKKWRELKFYEKYVRDSITGDDLSFSMEMKEFRRVLEALYEKSQLYK